MFGQAWERFTYVIVVPGCEFGWGRNKMLEDGIIWIGEKPTLKLVQGALHFTLKSEGHVCTFRMPEEIARQAASDTLFLLDQQARKPSNVRAFKKR
jgi:hypothetical protein